MPIDQPSRGEGNTDEEDRKSDDSERLREEDALWELRRQTRAYMMSLRKPEVDDGNRVSEAVCDEINRFVRGELPVERRQELWQSIKRFRSYRECWKSIVSEDALNTELYDEE